jgi:hypothetical protein
MTFLFHETEAEKTLLQFLYLFGRPLLRDRL